MAVMPRMPARSRPDLLPSDWSFHAMTIIGSHPLGPLPVSGFSCTRRLSGFGNGQFTIPNQPGAMDILGYQSPDQPRLMRLWSWKLWCFYGGVPLWCGVPTGVSEEGESYTTITLTELTNYLSKRQWDLEGETRYTQVEQTQIAASIAAPLADVGVSIVTSPGPGFLRDRSYEYLEGGDGARAQLLTNLAEVVSGPQFRSEYAMGPAGLPQCTLRIAYPRVGGPTHLGISVPGKATAHRVQWDSDQLRTRTFAVGELPESAPEGAIRPVAVEDRPQPDLPRLDAADDWPSTFLLSTLRERAATAAAQYADPVLELQETATLDDPLVTGYNVGDDVTVRMVTPLLPGGIEATGRLTEVTVSAGEGTSNWTVALSLPAPRPRESLYRRLDRIDTTLAGMYRRRISPQ